MNESMTSELRALRARAYGPGADLRHDPAAWDRLGELEDLVRGQKGGPVDAAAPEPAAEGAPVGSPYGQTDPAASVDHTDPPVDPGALEQPESEEEPPGRRWGSKRVAVVLIASVAMAVVVTAAVTGAISRRVQADPREVAVLGVDPFATVPEMFGDWECVDDECTTTEEVAGTVFTEFYGLSVFTLPGRFMGAVDDDSCLMIMESSQMETDPNSFSGRMYNGCGAGEFPAAVQLSVTPELPEELRDEFPEGSGLQFILQGDEVIVLSDVQ